MKIQLSKSDCLTFLKSLPSHSIDAIITDPPYPCVNREYGYWNVSQWMRMMKRCITQFKRVLTPTGSCLIILQPNSRKLGSMRTWLHTFTLWAMKNWNMVQDFYWWNYTMLPEAHVVKGVKLLRPSVKWLLWLGPPNCYRGEVLWGYAAGYRAKMMGRRAFSSVVKYKPSGQQLKESSYMRAAIRKGGASPYNIIPCPSKGMKDVHGATTPLKLCRYLVRYLCPPNGTVLDPFVGTGTVAIAALLEGRNAAGVDKEERYIKIAKERRDETRRSLAAAKGKTPHHSKD